MSSPIRSQGLRELGDTARELEKLVEHPSWKALRAQFEKRRSTYLSRLARQLSSGGIDAGPIDQRHIDYQRGFLAGAQAVLDTPDNALAALESALRREGERNDG